MLEKKLKSNCDKRSDMKKTDLIMVVVILGLAAFMFRNEITGFFIGPGMGQFEDTGDEVCLEDGKPIVYFFGSESCSHCKWEKPVINEVVSEFGDSISFHENIDNEDDRNIMSKYSTGGVPFIVIGCRFVRNGSGEFLGEEAEKQVLRNLICKVADSPVCG
jgi:thiol-disulfide isomerase/thioredoxin